MDDAIDAAYLQKFCLGQDEIRWYLCKPWSAGDWTYATNGVIMLRVKRLADVAECDKALNAAALFARTPPATDWFHVPTLERLPQNDCPKCDGSGIAVCDLDHPHDCDWCEMTGKVDQLVCVDIGNAAFNHNYLAMLQGFEISTTGELTAAHIRRGEITGLLMPMKKP